MMAWDLSVKVASQTTCPASLKLRVTPVFPTVGVSRVKLLIVLPLNETGTASTRKRQRCAKAQAMITHGVNTRRMQFGIKSSEPRLPENPAQTAYFSRPLIGSNVSSSGARSMTSFAEDFRPLPRFADTDATSTRMPLRLSCSAR